MKAIQLIVGLGNPGLEYESTRHNVGVWWIDELQKQYNLKFKTESKFFGKIATFNSGELNTKVFIPSTYMNESGKAVAAISKFYKIKPENILIIHDDLDLDPGVIKLKRGGGHGGHNGLRSIIPAIGNPNFIRLRIGIGHPGDKNKVSGFVLAKPNKTDFENINHEISISLGFVDEILTGNIEQVMNKLHPKRSKTAK